MISVGRLVEADRADWERLFRGYNEFYGRTPPPSMYEGAWAQFQEDSRMHALGAKLDGRLAGMTRFLVHASTTTADVCYPQDLLTRRTGSTTRSRITEASSATRSTC